jgi:predicted aspartyl protease
VIEMIPTPSGRCSWHRARAWRLILTALLTSGALVTSVGAQVYHWVDDQGVVHYTTGIESVPERYRAAARPLAVSPADSPASESPAAARAGATTIPFVAGAPILVAAQINGAGPVTLVLDTGADRTMVTPEALARLGILAPNTYSAEIRGVTGATRADVVSVEVVEVGNARVGPLAIVAHDAGLPQADGLLGRDFLSLFSVTIDARASVVTLEPN